MNNRCKCLKRREAQTWKLKLLTGGKVKWQEEEERKKKRSIQEDEWWNEEECGGGREEYRGSVV